MHALQLIAEDLDRVNILGSLLSLLGIAEDLDRVNILGSLLSLLGPAATSSVCLLVNTTMLCSLVYDM